MRGKTEIAAEITALRKALAIRGRWNDAARKTIEHTIRVLDGNMSAKEIEADYYVDETDADYSDGDNDLYNELLRVRAWMDAEPDYAAPSAGL